MSQMWSESRRGTISSLATSVLLCLVQECFVGIHYSHQRTLTWVLHGPQALRSSQPFYSEHRQDHRNVLWPYYEHFLPPSAHVPCSKFRCPVVVNSFFRLRYICYHHSSQIPHVWSRKILVCRERNWKYYSPLPWRSSLPPLGVCPNRSCIQQ